MSKRYLGGGISFEQENVYQEFSEETTPSGGGSLATLTDVDLTNPQDGQTLIYDAESGKWVNGGCGCLVDFASLTDEPITLSYDVDGGVWYGEVLFDYANYPERVCALRDMVISLNGTDYPLEWVSETYQYTTATNTIDIGDVEITWQTTETMDDNDNIHYGFGVTIPGESTDTPPAIAFSAILYGPADKWVPFFPLGNK